MANRHLSRTVAMQTLYEWDFNGKKSSIEELAKHNIDQLAPGLEDPTFIHDLLNGVEKHLDELDKVIVETAPEWPLDLRTIVDRIKLRLGIYDIVFAQ